MNPLCLVRSLKLLEEEKLYFLVAAINVFHGWK